MAKSAVSLLASRAHVLSFHVRASQSMEPPKNINNNVYKELGLFSLKKKIEDVVSRAEITATLALEAEEAKRIKQEEILLEHNLWDDLARSNESLSNLANSIEVVNELKDLRYKAEEAKLISQLAEMDIINDQLFKHAYKASVDVSKFLDRYEMSKLLSGPFDKEGACMIITAGPEGTTSEAEEAKLISQLAEMDIINDQLFKHAYKASVDVSKFLDRYEMSKLLSGPFDKEGACMIITAGPEGTTSEIWAENLLKMYTRWSKKHGYEGRIVEKNPSKGDGIKSATLEFEKEFFYGYLSGEKGVHRMIRSSLDGSVVRETCSAGVDVIPLFLESHLDLHIDDKDMEISSQTSHSDDVSARRIESAVSIHHIPSGITVRCSGERSHFANKMKAMNRLEAKLLVLRMEGGVSDLNKIKGHCTLTEWKHETRRYMFRPHKLVQDLRTGIHIPDLNSVLNGNIEPLIRAHITLRHGRDVFS